MRNSVVLFLLWALAWAGPLAARASAAFPRPQVAASFDVLGLRLVLNDEAQRLVQQKADGLSRHQASFQARVDMADAAFPIIDRVLKEEGVPLDFRYLVLQESALLGDAQSVHEAVGYWQFKRETAAGLGLVMNNNVDERKHLTASTRAAARYLLRNNASLRNWLNTLLSYNLGLTGVKPYVLPTDVNATEMAITEATSPYIITFLAHKVAFEPACGLNPKPPLRLQEFPATAGQTLEAQALALHTEPANLALHNRWLLAAAVPTDRPYTLIVPIGDVTQAAGIIANQRLQSSKELLNVPEVSPTTTAEVRLNNLRALIALPGETTADLAHRGNKRLGEFLRYNELRAFDVAITGRPYYLESKRDVGAVEYHVVQPKETVFDVAQKYGMRRKSVLNKNRMARNEELRPGRLLWLQHVRPREVAVEYRALPESRGIERRPVVIPQPVRSEPVAEQRSSAPVARAGKPSRKRRLDSEEGWGEALPSRTPPVAAAPAPARPTAPAPVSVPAPESAPVPAPASAPVYAPAPAPTVAQLPPPAAAPASAPLADEPREPELVAEAEVEPIAAPNPAPTVVAPAKPAPAVAAIPTPAPVPVPAPAKPAVPRPVPTAPRPVASATPTAATAAEAAHRVEPGETVYSISRRYQMSPATLMAMNNLTLPATLSVGQVLLLNAADSQPAAAAPVVAPVTMPVPAARSTSTAGRPNPAIYVPKPAASQAAPASADIQHTVAKGETLYSISKLYQVTVADLQAWNNKLDGNVRIGEVLTVKGK
ncbi:LysM peptidoglycan-binding domain-containing protein [Hymenobacter arizonensis]|uniref:Membrane-bound lytic murein transglycosylase D n=1 Tax=Hymenobacter arizonensis TaxID=1227077 RepID=A0A1I6AKI2_HYMAR|nr:LysM peptidoglycan-binding domain-containing protein [Hymenobacter arizonensis]SFQ69174.1 membrane-bound lytic murein transglycosylase D [Hymenobacter arizonensis]